MAKGEIPQFQVEPVPVRDVVAALRAHGIDTELAWWLANLDRKVWELEQRLMKLEKFDVDS
jgi:hypothetical protein